MTMNIKRFFTVLGVCFLLIFLTGGCDKSNNTNVNFTIDLTQSQFSQLQAYGGFVVYNGIIIAHTANNTYIAVSAYCTLDNEVLSFYVSQNYFMCQSGHQYSEQGAILNSPGAASLIVYHTSLVNNLLQIYS